MQVEQRADRTKRSHSGQPRLSLAAQIYLWGLMFLTIVLVVTALSTWLLVNEQVYASIDAQTEDVLGSFESELTEDTNALALAGKWLTEQGILAGLEKPSTIAESARALETFRTLENLDLIIVTDGHGRILSKHGSAGNTRVGDDISTSPDIAEALAGRMSTRAEVDDSGQLAIKVALPGSAQTANANADALSKAAVGTITLGFYVDDEYLKDVRKKARFEMGLVVISKDQLAASLLAGRGASPQLGQFGTSSLNLDDKTFHSDNLVTVMTNRGPYLYNFRPLSIPSRSSSIVVGSGMPTLILDSAHDVWIQRFGIWLGAGLLALVIVGFLMARSFSRPLKELSRAVQQIGRGDLHTWTVVERDDEIGDVAFDLDNMRQELSTKIEEINFEKNGLSTAITSMAVPVVITDSQNRIAAANRAAEALLGSQDANLAGRAWHTLFALQDGVDARGFPVGPSASHIVSGNPSMIVRKRLALNTASQPVLDVSSVPVHVESELVGYVHTLQDVSEIDRFAKAKNEFLLSVAHELEGPLASWRASVELLIEDYGEMTRSELGLMLRTLQKTAVRFQGLVEALVDMGKLEAGKFRIQPAETLYEKLIKDGLGQIEPVLQIRGQSLKLTIKTLPNTKVMADRDRISQVVINLIRNASKYSPEGEPITAETYAAGGRVFFQVTDNGLGIDPEEQERIFERYYRSKRVEEEGAGIGLGLALAKAIVEAHGGEIGVSSEIGKGSTFWFSLAEIGQLHTNNEPGDQNESVSRGR